MTSASPRLDKRRRTYVRLVGEIHDALNQALSEEKEKRGLNKTQIGKVLGLGRSAISKKFDGRHNMTLETLADLAFALDRPVKLSLPARAAGAGSNQPPAMLVSHSAFPVLASINSAEFPPRGQGSVIGSLGAEAAGLDKSLNAIRSGLASIGQTRNGGLK